MLQTAGGGELGASAFGFPGTAQEHYGITGAVTIHKWLDQYAKNHIQDKVVRVEKPDEKDRIRELKGRVAELERALGQMQAENVLNAEFLKLACEALGKEVKRFKKKAGGRGSSLPPSAGHVK